MTSLTILVFAVGTAAGQNISDDFNRPDGVVGNGWMTWNGTALSNGQVVTYGSSGEGGGVYRSFPVTYPATFSFDFRSESAHPSCDASNTSHPGGGWLIAFNAPEGQYSAGSVSAGQFMLFQYYGSQPIYRMYRTATGIAYDSVPSQSTDFGPSFTRISGTVNQDFSTTLNIGGIQYTFPPAADAITAPTTTNLVLSNSHCGGGPYLFDNLHVQLVPPVTDMVGPLTTEVASAPSPLAINVGASLTAAVSDATTGGSNILGVFYSIEGGSAIPMSISPSPAVTVQASAGLPPFSQSNVYNVCVSGTDSAGNSGTQVCVLVPVYDPSAGFVTGGGKIASAFGADLVNPEATGPATFGFVSKYQKGASVPTGNLTFQFHAGSLTFKSTSMNWLVVTGEPRAKFQGTGIVNGNYTCQFEVDAWDDSYSHGSVSNQDAFGVKIYSCNGGGDANRTRYSIDPTPLSGGSIIIHR